MPQNKHSFGRFLMTGGRVGWRGRIFLVFVLLILNCLIVLPGWCLGGRPPEIPKQSSRVMLIDDFENTDFTVSSGWWQFDRASTEIISCSGFDNKKTQALLISGEAKNNWYAGGFGCYIAKPGRNFSFCNNLSLDIFGYGPDWGNLKIELYDDDDGNWEITQSTKEAFAPVCDDRFVKEIIIDWQGWKRVSLPLTDFSDDNPGVGDDIWDPAPLGRSGGLLQMQFICLASQKTGQVQYQIDNVKFE